jgi:uncharacterized protein (UPF0128 family)
MNRSAYVSAVKRKDKEISELKKEKEVLLKALFQKEKEISSLNSLLARMKERFG